MAQKMQTSRNSGSNNDGNEFSNDKIDFYWKFIMQKGLKSVEIYSYENKEESFQKTYTLYNIQIKTEIMDFNLQRRFSEFHSLAQKIEKKYKEMSHLINNFPGKKLFGNLDPELIEQRKNQLNVFLKLLVGKYEECFCIEFLDFLEIKDKLDKINPFISETLIDSSIINKITSQDEKYLINILAKINSSPENLAFLFNEIEKFYSTKIPVVSIEFIKLFMFGENKLKGLLSYCGKKDLNDDSTHLVCTSGLRLLCRFFDYELNKEAEIYLVVFSKSSPSLLTQLNLNLHFPYQNQKPCSLFALRIFHFYMIRNPNLKRELIQTILNDDTGNTYDDYEKWRDHQKYISLKTENYGSLLDMEDNKIPMIDKNGSTRDIEERKISLELNSNSILLKEFLDNKVRKWDIVKQTQKKDIKIKHFQGIYIKMTIKINKSGEEIFNVLKKKTSLFLTLIEEYKILEKEDENCFIVYEKIRWNTSKIIKHLIFISEMKFEKENENDFYIYKRSVNRPEYLQKLNKEEYLSECVFCIRVRQKNENLSKTTVICKNFNQNSVLFLCTDLLGESRVLEQNLNYLKILCEESGEK